MDIIEQLRNYKPYNELEQRDKEVILKCIDTYPDIFERSNPIAHMTASAWIVNKDRTKILMAYHNIYKSFSWLGGHCDGERDCLKVALKEVQEESGIKNVKPVSEEILSIEALTVDGHYKHGKYVSSHLHLNVTYLIEADDSEPLKIKEDENSAVKWFDVDKAVEASNEEWFRNNVYSKLNEKMEKMI